MTSKADVLAARIFSNEIAKNKYFIKLNEYDFTIHNKLIYWGVKALGARGRNPETIEDAWGRFQLYSFVTDLIGRITPRQLMTLFPIDKNFKGHKYEMKDYFYTLEKCQEHGLDNEIGKGFEFLWGYMNRDVTMFMINCMSAMSDIRKFEGKAGLFEEFAAQNGLKTYKAIERGGQSLFVENLVITDDGRVL